MTKKNAADSVMDGGGLSGEHVPMEAPEAKQLLKNVYGIDGELVRLPAEKDDTFKVSVDGKPFYVLKVANPHDPDNELDFQIKLMAHVAKRDPSIPIPSVLMSTKGEALTSIVDQAGQSRKVWAITFLSGKVLDTFEINKHEREKVGEALGKIRKATEGFSHPFDSRIIAWDVKHVANLRPLLDFVENEAHKKNLEAGLDRIATLQPRINALRTQVLHNDFSRSNLLGDSDNPEFITGIIDFGDASRTAIAVEVSTALLHHLPRDLATNPANDIFQSERDIIRGYLRVAELTNEELELIPHLTMARVIARALITTRRAQLFPYNITYILRNTEPGWAQLEWFLARSTDEISQTFSEFFSN